MQRFEYRNLTPTHEAEKAYLGWIERLHRDFADRDVERRSVIVRDTLHEIYTGRKYEAPDTDRHSPVQLAQLHSFDPRNATLEPEYYGDMDTAKYNERKPLIWL